MFILGFKNTNNRLPNYEEMIKILDNTIDYVHSRKGLQKKRITTIAEEKD